MKTMREMINIIEGAQLPVGTVLPGGWKVVSSQHYKRIVEKHVKDVTIRRTDAYIESRSMHTMQGNGVYNWKPRYFKVIFPDGEERSAGSYREALAYAKGEE